MNYQIARDGDTIGTFTEDELVDAVETGLVLDSDLAWTEGMEEWVFVESIIEVEIIDEDDSQSFDDDGPSVTSPVIRPLGRLQPEQEPLPRLAPLPVRPLGQPQSIVHYAPHAAHTAPVQPIAIVPDRYGAPPPQRVPGNLYASIPPGHYGPAGSAVASMVLGILSVVLCCFTGIPAIICGHVARAKIRRSGNAFSGHGMATTGLVLGYVVTTIALLYGILMLAGIGSGVFGVIQKALEDLRAPIAPSAP